MSSFSLPRAVFLMKLITLFSFFFAYLNSSLQIWKMSHLSLLPRHNEAFFYLYELNIFECIKYFKIFLSANSHLLILESNLMFRLWILAPATLSLSRSLRSVHFWNILNHAIVLEKNWQTCRVEVGWLLYKKIAVCVCFPGCYKLVNHAHFL